MLFRISLKNVPFAIKVLYSNKNIKFVKQQMIEKERKSGYISEIVGSLIKIKGLENHVRLYDLIKIPKYNILGEVIQIFSDHAVAQCFENTINLKLNEVVISLNEPLSMEKLQEF